MSNWAEGLERFREEIPLGKFLGKEERKKALRGAGHYF